MNTFGEVLTTDVYIWICRLAGAGICVTITVILHVFVSSWTYRRQQCPFSTNSKHDDSGDHACGYHTHKSVQKNTALAHEGKNRGLLQQCTPGIYQWVQNNFFLPCISRTPWPASTEEKGYWLRNATRLGHNIAAKGASPADLGPVCIKLFEEAWLPMYQERRLSPDLTRLPLPSIDSLYVWQRLLNGTSDWYDLGTEKTLCRQGCVGLARFEWFENKYTGLFQRADFVLARFSSAVAAQEDPLKRIAPFAPGTLRQTRLAPYLALKVFRGGTAPSGNLLFAGRKTGQAEHSFFAHCLCTHLTERVPAFARYAIDYLKQYTQWPCALGLSHFANIDQDGVACAVAECAFPWCLVVRPADHVQPHPTEHFLEHLARIPVGTVLYWVYACPSPNAAFDANAMELIGKLVSASHFIQPAMGLDARLRFLHQRKEEDYELRPEWHAQLRTKHAKVGWEHFEAMLKDDPVEASLEKQRLPFSNFSWMPE